MTEFMRNKSFVQASSILLFASIQIAPTQSRPPAGAFVHNVSALNESIRTHIVSTRFRLFRSYWERVETSCAPSDT